MGNKRDPEKNIQFEKIPKNLDREEGFNDFGFIWWGGGNLFGYGHAVGDSMLTSNRKEDERRLASCRVIEGRALLSL